MEVFQVMSDEIQASINSLTTSEAWAGGVEAYFKAFSDNIDKMYEAAAAYDNFNSLIDGTANEYTEMDRAVSLASASTAAYVAALEAAGEELSEEDIQEIATEWAQYYAQMSDDLSAVTTEATALDQAIAALTGQFEAYWQEMIDAGIDVEKLGDKTELLDDAIQNLIDTMQTAVWDEITKSIQAMMSAVGSVESAVNNAIAALYQMKLAMDQVNASAEQYADFEAQALAALKYQMGLGSGYDRQAEIDERYGFLGVGYKEIIEAFAKLDIDSLKALAESWGINWWEIAEDVAWMIDNLEGAGDAASSAGADFAKLGEEIRSILSAVSDTFSGANSAANIMTQITDLQSIPMEEMTGDNLLAMSNKLVQWYNAAVAEAQNAAREEQDAANLLIRVADRLSSLITQIDSTIRSIKYSNLNISLPNQKAISAQGDYDTLLAAAQTGGVAEVQEYLGFAQTYLQQQQNTYKSSTAYQDKYTSVMSDMEAIKGRAEAGGYDAAILAELTRGNAQIEVDLSAIQATFSELESWILNALHQIEVISVLRIIWEDEWTPAQAAAISDLLTLVQEYGWDYEATITFIGELPMDLFEDLNEIATMAGWIASESGGWESSATISFIRNVAENWEWESLNEIMHALGWVREQAGSWTAGATIGFIAGLFDRYGIEYDSYAYWLGQLGVPDDAIPDVMAKLIFEAFQGSGMAIDDIDDYLTSLGITDSALRRDIEVQLVYNLHASGDIATEELADWAYAKLIAASTESVSNAYDMVDQVMALIRMFGVVDNSGNVGSILYQWSELARAGFPSSYYLGQGVQHVMDYAGWNEWAEGGVVSSPSLGWVGEAGYPEAIIPMKDGMNIPVKWVNGGSTQEGSERPLNIVVEVGGQEFNAIIDQRADDIRVRAERRKVGATRIVQ
jgi:hypothetical protein